MVAPGRPAEPRAATPPSQENAPCRTLQPATRNAGRPGPDPHSPVTASPVFDGLAGWARAAIPWVTSPC